MQTRISSRFKAGEICGDVLFESALSPGPAAPAMMEVLSIWGFQTFPKIFCIFLELAWSQHVSTSVLKISVILDFGMIAAEHLSLGVTNASPR